MKIRILYDYLLHIEQGDRKLQYITIWYGLNLSFIDIGTALKTIDVYD